VNPADRRFEGDRAADGIEFALGTDGPGAGQVVAAAAMIAALLSHAPTASRLSPGPVSSAMMIF
jgi:hypothetical protein